jgi:glucoside 3-dehydrogenase (cytochrome c) hitch-hiker subunit
MNRRDLLKLGAGAAAAPPASTIVALAAETAWTPVLFDSHQNETVIALSELIIPATDTPGAKAALVNRYLDKLLHEGPAETQTRFVEGLAWLDGYAIRKHSKPFVRCSPEQQTAILDVLDSGSESGLEPGREFFRLAKRRIADIYYATEIGFKELNKGGRVPSGLPGCSHSDHA